MVLLALKVHTKVLCMCVCDAAVLAAEGLSCYLMREATHVECAMAREKETISKKKSDASME